MSRWAFETVQPAAPVQPVQGGRFSLPWRRGAVQVAPAPRAPSKWDGVRFVAKVIYFPCKYTAIVAGLLLAFIYLTTLGRWRHPARPFWLSLLAALATAFGVGAYVAGLGLLAVAAAWMPEPWLDRARGVKMLGRLVPKRWIVDRPIERRYMSAVGLAVAAFAGWVDAAGWSVWTVAAWVVATCVGSYPWVRHYAWWGREPEPVAADALEFMTLVEPEISTFAGVRFVEFDPVTRSGVLEGPPGFLASKAARLDEEVEGRMNRQRGTVTLALDPNLTTRQLRITFSDRVDAGRMRFFDGPSLNPDGTWRAATADGCLEIYSRFYREDGACHQAIIAGPGGGKSVVLRLACVEAGLSPDILVIGVDGARGRGMASVRKSFRYYALTEADWAKTIRAVRLLVEAREARYGAAGIESFTPGPLNPMICLALDEMASIVKSARGKEIKRDLLIISGKGRGVGVGLLEAMQRGNEESYGGEGVRGNVIANGVQFIGPAGDNRGESLAKQSADVDLSTLPDEPGWWFVITKMIPGQVKVKARALMIPSAQDRDVKGKEAPYGVAEEWLAQTIHPELHPEDAAILAALEEPAPERDTAAIDLPQTTSIALVEDGPLSPAERQDVDEEPASWMAVRAVLTDAPEPLWVSEIAERTAEFLSKPMSEEWARTVVRRLAEAGKAEPVPVGKRQKWQAAA